MAKISTQEENQGPKRGAAKQSRNAWCGTTEMVHAAGCHPVSQEQTGAPLYVVQLAGSSIYVVLKQGKEMNPNQCGVGEHEGDAGAPKEESTTASRRLLIHGDLHLRVR
jgi:hypothetical protein